MTKKQRELILQEIAFLNDEQLKIVTIDKICKSIENSQVDHMIKMGFDERGIKEAEKYERYLDEVANFYTSVAEKRGITIWEKASDE